MGTSAPPLSLMSQLALLPVHEREAVLADLSDEEVAALEYDWQAWGRPNQLPPTIPWKIWLILAGRGFGKSRAGAEQVIEWARTPSLRIALVAETAADARDVLVEGESGILACSPPWCRPKYEPSKRRLTWPNGTMATTYSGDAPDQLRGPQHSKAWADECAKWKYAQNAWDMLELGLRLGDDPQIVATTTPRPILLIQSLVKEAQDPTSGVVVTRGSTYEIYANLAQSFISRVVKRFEGTRLGRQELHAEILTDTPGALWTLALLDRTRVTLADVPDLVRIGIALDPAATSQETSDEMGIIAGGRGANGHGYTLRDVSMRGTPTACARTAIFLYDELQADVIIAEVNNGGEWIGTVIKLVAENMWREQERASKEINYKMVHASRGKVTRAEPVATLFEQNRAHHVGTFAALEDQQTTWVPGMKSPDRMDAEVWLYTELLLTEEAKPKRAGTWGR